MRKEFNLERNVAIINFSSNYCDTSEKLLNSNGFRRVLESFIKRIMKKDKTMYEYLKNAAKEREVVDDIIQLFKLLLVFNIEEIRKHDNHYDGYFANNRLLTHFIEELYNYWRRLDRYTIVHNKYYGEGIQKTKFIEANNNFSNLVLSTYRRINETLLGRSYRVYRQLAAGGNAGIVINRIGTLLPEEYKLLSGIPFIESIVLNPPFITYPKQNTRNGMFKEVFDNPITNITFDSDKWFCFPAFIGKSLAFIYFHRDFLSLGVSLCNLFELASINECKIRKPDIILVFGCPDHKSQAVFYCDKINEIVVGSISYDDSFDYFGYLKKMALTLHNIKMIEQRYLPIHGAMVNITNNDDDEVNIVIIGDSGAGKSETLEALRLLGDKYIKSMKVIFDDMGTFELNDNELLAYGTEIGAFIRLDDLDIGYAYREIDRSIFMNPDKTNARVVIPITPYSDIIRGVRVDMIFYANNYELGDKITIFTNQEEAKRVFKQGRRKAKGTTSETGYVDTFFANPFGPCQRREETEKLIDIYFDYLFKHNIPVGEIRTKLAINGYEYVGPQEAALELLRYIKTYHIKHQ